MIRNYIIMLLIAITAMPMSARALAGDVAYMAAQILGDRITIRNNGEPADHDAVIAFMAEARPARREADYWHLQFYDAGHYDAEISCYKRNDGRCLVLHTISRVSADGQYILHSANVYIFDGKKLYPVKELPCNIPICDADFANGLGRYYYISAGGDPAGWDGFASQSNIEYRTLTERTLAVLVHNGMPGHRILELAWNGDKFMKRPGKMMLIEPQGLAGIALGSPLPKDGELGDVRLVEINANTYFLRQGSLDIARIDTKKDLVSCISITSPDYCTAHKISVGTQIDISSRIFASRLGSDIIVDQQGVQYRIDGNNICREIVIKQ